MDEIFPDDTTDVAVIAPAAKPPLPSLFTIVFAVLEDVAESTFDATVVIVEDATLHNQNNDQNVKESLSQ